MENLKAFWQSNKQVQKGVVQPNKALEELIENLKKI